MEQHKAVTLHRDVNYAYFNRFGRQLISSLLDSAKTKDELRKMLGEDYNSKTFLARLHTAKTYGVISNASGKIQIPNYYVFLAEHMPPKEAAECFAGRDLLKREGLVKCAIAVSYGYDTLEELVLALDFNRMTVYSLIYELKKDGICYIDDKTYGIREESIQKIGAITGAVSAAEEHYYPMQRKARLELLTQRFSARSSL